MGESQRLPSGPEPQIPPPQPAPPPQLRRRLPGGLAWLALAAAVAIAWLALPFATALLLGALLAFTLEPIHTRLMRHLRRPATAALVVVLVSGVIIAGSLAGFLSVFVARTVQLANAVRHDMRYGGPLANLVNSAIQWLGRFGINGASIRSQMEASASELAARAGGIAASLASSTFETLLGLFFAMLMMYVVLRHWERIVAALINASPLDSPHTQALLEEFKRVGRTTMTGTVVTGLAQGALAAIGYWFTGVPYPMFFGVATAFTSLIPAVGTLLVWVPAGVYLIATGQLARGILQLLWGTFVIVGVSDYVLRPRLVREESMPSLLVFISLFGGLEMLGLPGLVVGPLIVGLSVAVLRLYTRERSGR